MSGPAPRRPGRGRGREPIATNVGRHWIVIVVAGLLVWVGSVDNPFQYDDIHSIVNNLHVRSLDRLGVVFTDPASFSVDADKGMYRPLLVTTYALNHAVGNFDVTGYHAVNIAIHLGNAVLVWWLAGLLGAGVRGRLLAGLLFAVHPVAGEPVNYISSRSESLAALFYLLGLCLFLHGASRPWPWRLGVWVSTAAGLFTKSTVFTLPAVLLVCDYLLLSGADPRRLRRRWKTHHLPAWGVAAGYLVIVTGNRWLLRSLEQDVRGPLEQLLTQAKGLLYYLHLLTLPTHLSVEPQFFVLGSASVLVVSLSMALSAVGGAVALWRGRCRRALFLILWLLLYMLPTIVVPLNVLVNERRAYMPLAVACVAAGLLLVPALQRLRARPLLAVVSVLMLAVLSVQRTQVWADEMTLWRDAVVKGPGMSRAHLYLGNAHKDLAQHATDEAYRQQQWLAAAAAFERASATARGLDLALRALNNRGGVFFTLGDQALDEGRRAEALEHYERAEEIYRAVEARNPIYADALINLGNSTLIRARLTPGLSAAQRQKLLRESVAYYQRALEVRPNHSQGHSNLGVAYDDLGDWELAEARYRHALHLDGRDWLTMKNLAHLLQRRAGADIEAGRLGVAAERLQQARHLIDQALRLNPAVPGGRQVRDEIEARGRALRGGG